MPEMTSLLSLSHGKEPPLVSLTSLEMGTTSFVLYLRCLVQGWVSVPWLRVPVCWWVNVYQLGVIKVGLWAGILGRWQTWADGRAVGIYLYVESAVHTDMGYLDKWLGLEVSAEMGLGL